MQTCPVCQKQNPEGVEYCEDCGAVLSAVASPAMASTGSGSTATNQSAGSGSVAPLSEAAAGPAQPPTTSDGAASAPSPVTDAAATNGSARVPTEGSISSSV